MNENSLPTKVSTDLDSDDTIRIIVDGVSSKISITELLSKLNAIANKGTAVLSASGTVTVTTTAVAVTSKFAFTPQAAYSNMALRYANIVAGVSFDIVSDGGDLDAGLSVDWILI